MPIFVFIAFRNTDYADQRHIYVYRKNGPLSSARNAGSL